MPLCLIHNQAYKQDEFCVYCGNPRVGQGTCLTSQQGKYKDHTIREQSHICDPITDESGTYCKICRQSMSPFISR